jgi:hypothetical protein
VESIRARVESIRSALEDQLLQHQRQRSANPALPPTYSTSQIKLMTLATAQLYMLNLVNADRAKLHCSRLTLDFLASAVGQSHCDEMAAAGYFPHWDISGKKPWQRYSEAGGSDGISENLASIGALGLPGKRQPTIDSSFSTDDLELMERSFMSEKPPYDDHRAHILAPEANRLGVGLTCATNSAGLRVCLAQEFVTAYSQYSALPKTIVCRKPFEVAGSLLPGVKVYSVSVDWENAPKPMSADELRGTYYSSHGDLLMADISVENERKFSDEPLTTLLKLRFSTNLTTVWKCLAVKASAQISFDLS